MKYSIFAFLILFSSIVFGQNDKINPPKIGIKVPLNQYVDIHGISIKFIEVVEDSRCPKDVNCIWAGRAIVKAEVTSNGKKEEKTLIFGEIKGNEIKNTNLYSSDKFAINGLTLNPYPTAENAGEGTEYVLLVCEEKNR